MKCVILLICICFSISAVLSQTTMLYVKQKDGMTKSFPIRDIKKITFSGFTGVGDERQSFDIIKTFALLQNYPNPFNPSTTIEYEIPKPGTTEISIYNLNGQCVKKIMQEYNTQGIHRTTWDGTNEAGQTVASGVYIYQVKADNLVLAKKMMFIK